MKEESVKINCSFCNKEIECPKEMLNSKKHACYECFEKLQDELPDEEIQNMHVDIPMDKMDDIAAKVFIEKIMDGVFPEFWKEAKDELKDMSRKDAVIYAFIAGAKSMFDEMIDADKSLEKGKK
jgi:hypothetical protein